MVDDNPQYEPFGLFLSSSRDGLVNGRQYMRITYRTVQATLTWPAGEKGYEDLLAFASTFEHIVRAARQEMYVRDSMRDLDREVTDFLTPDEDEE